MLKAFPNKVFFFLSIIILLAFFLRFYKVTEVPPSLNWDEISIGYNAYSILKTGKDEWGQSFPLHFKSYGEYKLPGQIYASIPAIAILGLNDFSVRLTPIIYGTLTVLLMFFLGRAMFQSAAIGLVSAFFLAVSPWHIHLTRGSFEASFAVFWVVLGAWLLVKGFKEAKWAILSMIPFAIAVYTYNSARVFVPLLLFIALAIYWKNFKKLKKQIIMAMILFAALMLPLIPFVLSGEGSARYKLVSITDEAGLIPRINQNRGNSNLPDPLPRLIHNKLTYVSFYFSQNFLAHFTPQYLFISGAPHKQHHVQDIGQLYWIQAPLLLGGLYLLFRRKQQFRWFLIAWILAAFVPVATTRDSIPHALRTINAVPAYQLICAYGLMEGLKAFKRFKFGILGVLGLLGMVWLVQFAGYLNNYYNKYPISYSRDWQYGNKAVVEYIKDHYNEYDLIVYTRHFGEPHMFTLFHMDYDPAAFQKDSNLNRFETFDWIRVLNFDKFYFPDLGDTGTRYDDVINQFPNKKILFIGKNGDFPPTANKLEEVNFLNGDKGFEIVDRK